MLRRLASRWTGECDHLRVPSEHGVAADRHENICVATVSINRNGMSRHHACKMGSSFQRNSRWT